MAKAAKTSATPKNKGGRPSVPINIEEFEKLASLQCTQEDAAAWFGCGLSTIKRKLKEQKYREAWDRGLGNGRVSLRRKQMKLADKNATMAIFLGKQYLGQRDLTAVELAGKDDAPVSFIMNIGAGRGGDPSK